MSPKLGLNDLYHLDFITCNIWQPSFEKLTRIENLGLKCPSTNYSNQEDEEPSSNKPVRKSKKSPRGASKSPEKRASRSPTKGRKKKPSRLDPQGKFF